MSLRMMVLLRPRLGNAIVAALRAGALGTARGHAAQPQRRCWASGNKPTGIGVSHQTTVCLRHPHAPCARREAGLIFVLDPAQNGLGPRVQPLAPLGVEAVAARHMADDGLNKLR
jgi:hypothetical protein